MWNVFDTSFIIIFLLYIMLRVRGLATGDGKFQTLVLDGNFLRLKRVLSESVSKFGFDILACGACILFPR